jgi:hypothetical protein
MTLDEPRTMPTTRTPSPTPQPPRSATPTLGDVVARIGVEVAAPLTAALERVVALASSGRIDRHGLQALRGEIDGARRVGLRGQQIARLASGEVRQIVERLDLPQCLQAVLHGQAAHAGGQAITLPPAPTKAEVLGDASLLHAVLDAAADWSAALARANVDWRIDVQPWPVRARVLCRFAHLPADHATPRLATHAGSTDHHHEPSLDTLDWLLLAYTAHIAGVVVHRQDGPTHTLLTLEFLNTVNGTLEGAAAVDLVAAADGGAKSIAGSQVLVLASQRRTRQRLREAFQRHDLMVDYVSTVADAAQFFDDGAPQVLVYETAFNGAALAALLAPAADNAGHVALVEVLPAGRDCNMGALDKRPVTQLGIDAIQNMLLPVMVLELGRACQR